MKPKFTPGPWHVASNGRSVRSNSRAICTINWTTRKGHQLDSEADARLVAAAPDLYDALNAINDSATDGREIPEWLQERLVDARAALAKAGETS